MLLLCKKRQITAGSSGLGTHNLNEDYCAVGKLDKLIVTVIVTDRVGICLPDVFVYGPLRM